MRKKPEILNCQTVATSRLFKIESLQLKFSNGEERVYERLKGPSRGAVLIVPFLDDKTIILVREYAAGVEDYELGFPKGLMEPDESFEEAANRELMEEASYGATKLTVLKTMATAPGYLGSQMTVVLAKGLYEKSLPADEPEPPEVVHWKINDIDNLLAQPDFTEARSIAALLLAFRSEP